MENYKLNLEAPWEDVKEQIKEVYPELTDEDLNYIPGRDKEFLEALAKRWTKMYLL